jgi:DNA-binding NarL/FixJ family response regulator
MPTPKQVARSKNKKRILVVDDHPILREGLRGSINRESDMTVCGEAGTAPDAMRAIASLKPDFAIVDISLNTGNGLALVKEIREQYPQLPMLVLSIHDESLYAERALRSGARGYIMKQEPPEKLLSAIRQILAGDIYVSEEMSKKIVRTVALHTGSPSDSPIEGLTDRELEIFDLLGRGRSRGQIAQDLHLSVKTVESHRANIRRKLNLTDASSLLRHAIQWVERSAGN